MARKPITEKNIAENVLKWGVGGINIDGCRVEADTKELYRKPTEYEDISPSASMNASKIRGSVTDDYLKGRFPANLIHDGSDEVKECFPNVKTGSIKPHQQNSKQESFGMKGKFITGSHTGDSGSASRFFKSILYYPKASKKERNMGCEGLEEKQYSHDGREKEIENPYQRNKSVATNNHPTVKPIALMEYLIKMVTPKGGIVLDPFIGSGSTGVAAKKNGYDFIGIDMTPEYVEIAKARINATEIENRLL
jgi:site-specific DNA-methyltransferase (adenine-specific)